jgi:hypothetical protein
VLSVSEMKRKDELVFTIEGGEREMELKKRGNGVY